MLFLAWDSMIAEVMGHETVSTSFNNRFNVFVIELVDVEVVCVRRAMEILHVWIEC